MQERNNGRSRGGRTGGAMKTNPEQIQRVKEGQQRCNPLPCVFGPRPSFACFEASPSYYARQYQLPAPLRFAFFGPWRSPTLRIWRDRACRLATATNALGTPPRHQARMYQRFGETNTSALDSGEPVPAELGLSVAQAYCAPKSRGVPRDETWLPSTKAAEAGGYRSGATQKGVKREGDSTLGGKMAHLGSPVGPRASGTAMSHEGNHVVKPVKDEKWCTSWASSVVLCGEDKAGVQVNLERMLRGRCWL
ncbi:hypothetical protein B0H14DRAFT_2625823 [Mycena olivaceomarginata]|nr:hypothetical protein B0H14DRAFT_2625823 [Mycena olivaceomarginata]